MAAKADTTAGIRKLWGIAKSPELRLSDEDLHLVVQEHTGKDSIKELNNRELNTCIRVLLNMKDSAKGKNGSTKRRRSGNPATENQRKKVYKLTQELGWEKPTRVNGLCHCHLHCLCRPDFPDLESEWHFHRRFPYPHPDSRHIRRNAGHSTL